LYVILGFAQMRLEALLELRVTRFFDHFRQCLHDLPFSVVDVAQRVHEQVIHVLDVLGEETHSGSSFVSERICGSESRQRLASPASYWNVGGPAQFRGAWN